MHTELERTWGNRPSSFSRFNSGKPQRISELSCRIDTL